MLPLLPSKAFLAITLGDADFPCPTLLITPLPPLDPFAKFSPLLLGVTPFFRGDDDDEERRNKVEFMVSNALNRT
jgi:hypothetical protein